MKRLIILTIALLGVTFLNAQIPERPSPQRLVNDFAGILEQNEFASLEQKLEQFARETSTQILVVTVDDLQGYDAGDFAFRIGEKWGVGQSENDNGIVILLKPKTGNENGQIFIATGYGLEGVLPDAVVNGDVVDTEMIPQFQKNNYYKGLVNGINVIMDITRGEYTAEYYQENYAQRSGGLLPGLIFFIVIFVIVPI
ncbi:MAG: TPM domain-containing protein, partial [Tangfeifania sp.]